MARFFVRGIDHAGRRKTERIEAATGEAALLILARKGWRELELLTDAMQAAIDTPEGHRIRTEKAFTPEEHVVFYRRGPGWMVWMAIKKSWPFFLLIFVWAAWRLTRWSPWDWFDNAISIGAVAFLAMILFQVWSVGRFSRMLRAGSAGRWEEALERIASLERSSLRKMIPPSELALRRANALLGLGREAEAISVIDNMDRSGIAEWALLARIADFHSRRRDLATARACLDRAAELGADHPESQLILAEFFAGNSVRDPVLARQAMERAKTKPLAASLRWGVARIEGKIAVEEERWQEALAYFKSCRKALLQIDDAGLHPAIFAEVAAYEAIALAHLGHPEQGRAVMNQAEVETWLKPHQPELLGRAYAAVA